MPPSSTTDNLDYLVLRLLGVSFAVILMYGVWESINTPDYVIQIPIFFGLLGLVVILLGVGGVAIRMLRAYRGSDTMTPSSECEDDAKSESESESKSESESE